VAEFLDLGGEGVELAPALAQEQLVEALELPEQLLGGLVHLSRKVNDLGVLDVLP
jgi:hypothetical protein